MHLAWKLMGNRGCGGQFQVLAQFFHRAGTHSTCCTERAADVAKSGSFLSFPFHLHPLLGLVLSPLRSLACLMGLFLIKAFAQTLVSSRSLWGNRFHMGRACSGEALPGSLNSLVLPGCLSLG